ncbi:hypothetical protein STEG23_006598 [Scotinomys teguina]
MTSPVQSIVTSAGLQKSLQATVDLKFPFLIKYVVGEEGMQYDVSECSPDKEKINKQVFPENWYCKPCPCCARDMMLYCLPQTNKQNPKLRIDVEAIQSLVTSRKPGKVSEKGTEVILYTSVVFDAIED